MRLELELEIEIDLPGMEARYPRVHVCIEVPKSVLWDVGHICGRTSSA